MDLDKVFGLGSEDEDEFDLDAELEAITTPKAQIGDIYDLGGHRLMEQHSHVDACKVQKRGMCKAFKENEVQR